MNVGVLGLGEVGTTIKMLAAHKYPTYGRSLEIDEIGRKKIDTLHICIPYSEKFVEVVVATIKELKPRLVIINSTVKVGTTSEIGEKTNCLLAHSPVRGVHPDLYGGLKTIKKMIGGIDEVSSVQTAKHFGKLGVKTFSCESPEATELGKLLSTTYYAWNIVFQKEAHKLCEENGVDPLVSYDIFNLTYNDGYEKLGKPHVVRPTLKQVDGKIGGHCLTDNAKILGNNPLSKFILERNETYDEKDA